MILNSYKPSTYILRQGNLMQSLIPQLQGLGSTIQRAMQQLKPNQRILAWIKVLCLFSAQLSHATSEYTQLYIQLYPWIKIYMTYISSRFLLICLKCENIAFLFVHLLLARVHDVLLLLAIYYCYVHNINIHYHNARMHAECMVDKLWMDFIILYRINYITQPSYIQAFTIYIHMFNKGNYYSNTFQLAFW